MSQFSRKMHAMIRRAFGQRDYWKKDHLVEKVLLQARIDQYSSFGWVRICWNSQDCDGVRVTGRSEVVPAMVTYVAAFVDRLYQDAEGPLSWGLESPRFRPEIHVRDLGMEAFENGHPHVIRG